MPLPYPNIGNDLKVGSRSLADIASRVASSVAFSHSVRKSSSLSSMRRGLKSIRTVAGPDLQLDIRTEAAALSVIGANAPALIIIGIMQFNRSGFKSLCRNIEIRQHGGVSNRTW